MFQILTFTEARLATLTNRSEKHGDEDVPATSLGLEITAANTLLDVIDPKIRHSLYMAVDGQEDLPGVEQSTPVLRCNSFERHTLPAKYEGWTLQVDDGIDDTKPMTFGTCKVDKLSVEAKQGGSIVLRLRVGTSDLDAARSGFLGMHVGQPVWITLTAPEKKPDAIDASGDAKDLPPNATDLFSGGPPGEDDGPEDEDSEGGDPDATGDDAPIALKGGGTLSPEAAWPFPKDPNGEQRALNERLAGNSPPPQSVTVERSQPQTRTARGRDKTAKALKAGATH